MISKQFISRQIIFFFIFLTGLWTHSVFLIKIKKDINKDDCSFDPTEIFLAILIIDIVANIFLSVSFIQACLLLLNYEFDNDHARENRMDSINFWQLISSFLFFICGILTSVTFFKSDYLSGKFETCSNIDAEIAFRLFTFSFAWIAFLIFTILGASFLFIFLQTIGIALKESNLISCSSFWSCRKITPILTQVPNDKNIQTETLISIPISSLQNEIKPFTCMICMVNMIDVILKPCCHICICNECHKKLSKKNCPCCNLEIKKTKTLYVSNLN